MKQQLLKRLKQIFLASKPFSVVSTSSRRGVHREGRMEKCGNKGMTESEARAWMQEKLGTTGKTLDGLSLGDWSYRLAGRLSVDDVDGIVAATGTRGDGSKSTKLEQVLARLKEKGP